MLRYRVSFEEATTVFGDPPAATIADPDHSEGEPGWLTMGFTSKNRLLVVSHTESGETTRIISAREANTHERKAYES